MHASLKLVNSSVTNELIIVVITSVISRVRVMDTASDVVQEDSRRLI